MGSARRGIVLLLLAVLAGAMLAPASVAAAGVTSTNFTVTSSLDGVMLKARYYRPTAPGRYPVVMIPHGGGGDVNSEAGRAQAYAAAGYVGVVWTARGHGAPPDDSGGLYDFFGPKTVQDARDVLDWLAAHPETGADAANTGILGYSQGGGTTNLVAKTDPRIKAISPGHTFSGLIESLKPNGCVKLSVDGVILSAAYLAQKARPDPDLISRWSAYLASGQEIPSPTTGEVPSQELEDRSPRNFTAHEPQPAYEVQAFDDPLFPVDQAVLMYRLMPNPNKHLYLSWGGHFQPQPPQYELDYREVQVHRWMDRWLQGTPDGIDLEPPVTYWYLAADRLNLVRRETTSWPPPEVRPVSLPLATGQAVNSGGAQGLGEDPAVRFGAATTGLGAVVAQLPHHTAADSVVTQAPTVNQDTLYAGSAHAEIRWTATTSPSQVIVKTWDVAPDGSATMLGRACTTATGPAGVEQRVQLDLWHSAVEVPAGHHVEAWVQAADAPLWEPGPPNVGTVGEGSTITLPLMALHDQAGAGVAGAAAPPATGSDATLPLTSTSAPHLGRVAALPITILVVLLVGLGARALLLPRTSGGARS